MLSGRRVHNGAIGLRSRHSASDMGQSSQEDESKMENQHLLVRLQKWKRDTYRH